MKNGEVVLLGLAVLAGLLIRLHFFTGLIASDDLTYAQSAHRMFQGAGDQARPDVTRGSVAVRRLGVHLPLFVAMRVFGVHEWSLALAPLVFSLGGIVAAYATLRLLAGPAAGLLAAWLWACLPADVYTATVWLPDNIFASVCMVMIYFLAASEVWSRRQWLAALLAGVALGYLEYVKEAAYVFLLPLLAWEVYAVWRTRRFDWRPAFILAGFVFVQGLASLYFWTQGGGPFVFWKLTFSRYSSMMFERPPVRPFPANIAMGEVYLFEQWILGYGLVLFPVLLVAALMDRRWRLRGRLALLLVLQMFIVMEGWKLGSWTQRYILHATPTIIVLSVLGIRTLLSRLPPRWDQWTMLTASVVGVVACAAVLRPERQQHGRSRADVLRRAHAYLGNAAGPDDPIYADISRLINYTPRAFEILSGYQPFKGGLQTIDRAYRARTGWVLRTHLDDNHPSRKPARSFRGVAPNWLEVFRTEEPDGDQYARVFKILPAAPPPFVTVVPPTGRDTPPRDLRDLRFTALPLPAAPEALRSRRWTTDAATVEIAVDGDGVRCVTQPDPTATKTRYAGVQFAVHGLAALRGNLELTNAQDVEAVYVYLYGDAGSGDARYQRRLQPQERRAGWRETIVIAPGQAAPGFRVTGDIAPDDVRQVHVFVRVAPGAAAGFTLRNLEIATPALVTDTEISD